METSARLLDDRYELGSLLASGGMGRVWRGRDTVLNRPVAVKILRSEFTGDPAFVARFRAEAQHAAALHHPTSPPSSTTARSTTTASGWPTWSWNWSTGSHWPPCSPGSVGSTSRRRCGSCAAPRPPSPSPTAPDSSTGT